MLAPATPQWSIVNLVGGQDELVFDGASVVIAPDGKLIHRSPQFEEDLFVVDVPLRGEEVEIASVAPLLTDTEEVYRALTVGLRDYCHKNGFSSVVVGLSGGIDSALTAAISADALGPTRYGASRCRPGSPPNIRSTTPGHSPRISASNSASFPWMVCSRSSWTRSRSRCRYPVGTAEENLQARTRGAILMAISNKHGPMVVATGNKSEMAVGYATLYGDMVGGYAVLKDVFKGLVYELARWRNTQGTAIPPNTIDKPPSAELRPDQRDSDSLPPYDVLDAILERYIEDDLGVPEIISEGFDEDVVRRVARLVDRSEYKRRQSAPRREDNHEGLWQGPQTPDHQWVSSRMIGPVTINGVASDGRIPVSDASVLRGDGCFEVIKAYSGRPFALDAHLDRLQVSASKMDIDLPPTESIRSWIEDAAEGVGDGAVRVVVTRGSAIPGLDEPPRVIVFSHPWAQPAGPARLWPLHAPWHSAGAEWALAGAKVLSYAPNMSATRDAVAAGFDDALLITLEDVVLEGPTFSVAWVVDGVVETPDLGLGILDSITRKLVIDLARDGGLEVREGSWQLTRLDEATEVMAWSTIREVQPVVAVGAVGWDPGPVTESLAAKFSQLHFSGTIQS